MRIVEKLFERGLAGFDAVPAFSFKNLIKQKEIKMENTNMSETDKTKLTQGTEEKQKSQLEMALSFRKLIGSTKMNIMLVPMVAKIGLGGDFKDKNPETYYSVKSDLKILAQEMKDAVIELDKAILELQ